MINVMSSMTSITSQELSLSFASIFTSQILLNSVGVEIELIR